jgi:predicted nucleotide-binding protein
MYYHVIIETKNKESHYELDKQDNDEILRRFVKPYIQGKQIQIDGYFLKKEDITRFKITQSDDSAATMHREYISQLHADGIMAGISPESLIEEKKDITEALFEKVKTEVQLQPTSKVSRTDNSKVFIVHGHDDLAKIEVARFLEKLGLTAVILSEQPNEGKTIIEKLEAHTDVGFGIVLYTPDDEGRLIEQVAE